MFQFTEMFRSLSDFAVEVLDSDWASSPLITLALVATVVYLELRLQSLEPSRPRRPLLTASQNRRRMWRCLAAAAAAVLAAVVLAPPLVQLSVAAGAVLVAACLLAGPYALAGAAEYFFRLNFDGPPVKLSPFVRPRAFGRPEASQPGQPAPASPRSQEAR